MTRTRRTRLACAAALGVLAPAQLLALAVGDSTSPATSPATATATAAAAATATATTPRVGASTPTSELAAIATPVAPAAPGASSVRPAAARDAIGAILDQLVTEDATIVGTQSIAASSARASGGGGGGDLANRFPAQMAASQDPRDPASTRWALLVGINDHMGRVADNVGSRQDAEDMRAHLLASGWRDDHILLLTDRAATGDNIRASIDWLASKVNRDSVAIFHYSGHSKKWPNQDVDGDGEHIDEGLWPTDDRFISDGELAARFDRINPHALWMNFSTCNAAGLADPGLVKPGRVLTFSSGEPQKSYENPAWENSVWGWYLIDQGLRGGQADANGDGRLTVEESFEWARVRAAAATSRQRFGQQDAVIVDLVDGDFDFRIPPPPAPPAPRQEAPEQGGGNILTCLLGNCG